VAMLLSAFVQFDKERLAKVFQQPLINQACDDVHSATGGDADNNTRRPPWIGLNIRCAPGGTESGGPSRKMQKFTT